MSNITARIVEKVIIVSTDGSCLRNPGGAVGWAWVNHQGPSSSGGSPSGTNQVAELTAVLEALRAHRGDEPMVIETDSQYAVNCATEWLPGWKRRGWKTTAGAPVSNRELIVAIDQEITDREGPVRFRWVRGHVGNHFNEMADRLAGEAAREAATAPADSAGPGIGAGPAASAPAATRTRRSESSDGTQRSRPDGIGGPVATAQNADGTLTLF